MQKEPDRPPTQEKNTQGFQWSYLGVLQEQSPSTTFRPGEQPPTRPQTWQEKEETPQEEETCLGKLKYTVPVCNLLLSYGYITYAMRKG